MIRAVFKNGAIQPREPLPHSWLDGQELKITEASPSDSNDDEQTWYEEFKKLSAEIPAEDFRRISESINMEKSLTTSVAMAASFRKLT